jgi:DNA polymerase IIIc chi subunit
LDNKFGKYGRKLIYALNKIMTFTAPIFMKLKLLNETLWTSYKILFNPHRSKTQQEREKTALTVSDFTKLKADERNDMDIYQISHKLVNKYRK